ncbi:unnamed protein product, partial [Discosporangium mesarthrocarpum]
ERDEEVGSCWLSISQGLRGLRRMSCRRPPSSSRTGSGQAEPNENSPNTNPNPNPFPGGAGENARLNTNNSSQDGKASNGNSESLHHPSRAG